MQDYPTACSFYLTLGLILLATILLIAPWWSQVMHSLEQESVSFVSLFPPMCAVSSLACLPPPPRTHFWSSSPSWKPSLCLVHYTWAGVYWSVGCRIRCALNGGCTRSCSENFFGEFLGPECTFLRTQTETEFSVMGGNGGNFQDIGSGHEH